MAILGVVLKSVEARRFQDPQPNQQVRIDHSSNISLVESQGDDRLRVDFAYTTSYGAIGVVKIEGSLGVKAKDAPAAAKTWGETRNLPTEIAQSVHSAIMNACIPEAVGLAKGIRLPPPIPLPQVKIQEKGQAKTGPAEGAADPYGSPEIG